MFWFKPFRNFLRKISIFRNFDQWSEILSVSDGRPLGQGVCPSLVAGLRALGIETPDYIKLLELHLWIHHPPFECLILYPVYSYPLPTDPFSPFRYSAFLPFLSFSFSHSLFQCCRSRSEFFHPDPGSNVKKVPDPGYGSANKIFYYL